MLVNEKENMIESTITIEWPEKCHVLHLLVSKSDGRVLADAFLQGK